MRIKGLVVPCLAGAVLSVVLVGHGAAQTPSPAPAEQAAPEPFTPQVGQPGKDVVWVPTSAEMVELMLDFAKVTKSDVVVDLGSGDGRNVIAAAKRGAKARGVEFNPDMVALSRRNAEAAGVANRARFVEGDMFEADISDATVMALFLLPSNMRQLRTKFFNLKPGSRIVANTFGIEEWEPDEKKTIEGPCETWCTAMLWIVPAKVEGTWRTKGGQLQLTQKFQNVSGTLTREGESLAISNGKLRGEDISFEVGGTTYAGRVEGNSLKVTAGTGKDATTISATRVTR